MLESVDWTDLGSVVERRVGSSPTARTTMNRLPNGGLFLQLGGNMELSQFVVDAIGSTNQIPSRHYFTASTQLKSASSETDNTQDAHILNLVANALTIRYKSDTQSFNPLARWNDGSRSFALEDFQENDIAILEEVYTVAGAKWIRAHLAHIIWIVMKNYQYGQNAVSEYLLAFEEIFDPSSWSECWDMVRRAFDIAVKLGKSSDSYKQVRSAINKKLELMNGSDPLFLSLCLIELVMKDATKEELSRYLQIVTILADKNIRKTNPNTHLADKTFSLQESLLRRLKMDTELAEAKWEYADYYSIQAEQYANQGDYLRAVRALQKACTMFQKIDREKTLELRIRLEGYQKNALKNMDAFPIEIDTRSSYHLFEQLFNGLTLQEGIIQLGRIVQIHRVEDVKTQVYKTQEESVFSSLFGSILLNESGQTVVNLPPLSNADEAETDLSLLHKYMVRHVAELRRTGDYINLGIAFNFFRQLGDITESDLDFLIENNALIPEGRGQIIKEGLCLGLSGELYASLHILLPQTEHIFRNLVKMCGDTVTFLKEDGTEEYKPLSQLLKSEKLHECYSEDIIFTFYSIMDDAIGENLRNLNAHGLLEPHEGNGGQALCFVCLLIKLLFMYSKKATPIIDKLSARDPS